LSFDILGPDLLAPTIGRHSQPRWVNFLSIDMVILTSQVCALVQSVFLLSSAKVGLGEAEEVLSSYKLRTALQVRDLLDFGIGFN